MLFHVPPDIILGVSVDLGGTPQEDIKEERKGIVNCLKTLTARPNWVEKIMAVWNNVDNEKIHEFKKMHREVTTQYCAQNPPDFMATFEYRGTCRICMLRIIASLTHIADECDISDFNIVSLLRISHAGSQMIKNMQQISTEQEGYTWLERSFELFRSSLFSVFTLEEDEPPTQVANESIIGPTAFIRLLTVLAQRGSLRDIHKWKKLPPGTSESSLERVKQVASTENIQRVLKRIVGRVTECREVGHRRFREGNSTDAARFSYASAVELAAALVAFDDATAGKYESLIRGTRKELVLCLGNAAEMALGIKKYRTAFSCAAGADMFSKNLPPQDIVDDAIIAKNKRRVERARVGLRSASA